MSEVKRYKVIKMLSEAGNKISYDPHGPKVVLASDYDAIQSQMAALREELTTAKRSLANCKLALDEVYRTAEKLPNGLSKRIKDALKPTESGDNKNEA